MEAREQKFTVILVNVGNATLEVTGKLPDFGAVIEFGENLELEAVVIDLDNRGRRIARAALRNPEAICQPPIRSSVQAAISQRPRTTTV